MRFSFLALMIMLYGGVLAQSPCEKVQRINQLASKLPQVPLHRLKKMALKEIPDSVQQRMPEEIRKVTGNRFLQKVKAVEVRIYDEQVKQRMFTQTPILNAEGNEVDFLYVVFYEVTFNDRIPFLFKGEFLRSGALFNIREVKDISGTKKVISCARAIAHAKADKEEQMGDALGVIFYYDPTFRCIVYGVQGKRAGASNEVAYKVVKAKNGEILSRYVIKDEVLEETRIEQK